MSDKTIEAIQKREAATRKALGIPSKKAKKATKSEK